MDLRKLNVYILAGFYIFAGANHFINPEFYYPLIPAYFGFLEEINVIAGVAEVQLGLMLLGRSTRRISSYLIVVMLLAFVPSHVYFIQIGSCVEEGLCVPEWVGWGRLLVIHPLLLYWAWSVRNISFHNPEKG